MGIHSNFMLSASVAVLLASSMALATPSKLTPQVAAMRARHALSRGAFLGMSGGSDEAYTEIPNPMGEPLEKIQPPAPPGVPELETTDNAIVDVPSSRLGANAPSPGLLRKAFPAFPWHKVPNSLTYIRCLAIPVFVALFYQPKRHLECGIIFAVASFTDWLDGFLARRWDITSPFGAFLDPVADKLMVSTALILLSGHYGMSIAIPASIILAREIAVSALREWMAQRGLRDSVKVGFQGKVKAAATMCALTLLLLVPLEKGTGFLTKLYQPGLALLYLSTVVTVTSGSVYFRAAAPVLFGHN
jgi:CDP-diacylglycerol--glycerol-3-phosphate 3-phosphatidyltransferase